MHHIISWEELLEGAIPVYEAPEAGDIIKCTMRGIDTVAEVIEVGRKWATILVQGKQYRMHLATWLVYAPSTKSRKVPNPKKIRGYASPIAE